MELWTGVAALDDLTDGSCGPYTGVYLGFPYCRPYPGNLLEAGEDLARAVGFLHRRGQKAFLATPPAPATADLAWIAAAVGRAREAGIDGAYVHNLGLVRLLSRAHPDLPLHAGCFANVYTGLTAGLLAGHGVRRVAPHFELSLAEMRAIGEGTGLEVEVLVHGAMPLSLTDRCHAVTALDQECPLACRGERWLTAGDLRLRTMGQALWSGRDVCLAEHMARLGHASFVFRVESLGRDGAWRRAVGEIYARLLAGEPLAPAAMDELARLAPWGLCNGYYFGLSGRTYVNGRGEVA